MTTIDASRFPRAALRDLLAGNSARKELGWSPGFDALEAIVETAWRWFAR